MIRKHLADNLRRLREANKLTQKKVADDLEINLKSINSYENGRCSPPLDKLKAMANYYAHSVDDLLTENLEVLWKKI